MKDTYESIIWDLVEYTDKIEEMHEGVLYTIYEAKGGSFGGANALWYWGFINGIQFHDFKAESDLLEYEREISQDTLKLVFDYALYTEPFFKPEGGIINRPTPIFVNDSGYNEEVRIAGLQIPKRSVIPLVRSPDINYVRENIKKAIHVYNIHRNQINDVMEKLENKEIQKGLSYVLKGLHVHNLSYSVAEFLGKQGASFIVKSPYHLERQREIQEFKISSLFGNYS